MKQRILWIVFAAASLALTACQPIEQTPVAEVEPTTDAVPPALTATPVDPCAPVIRVETWQDMEGDRVRDPDDPPLAGVRIAIFYHSHPSEGTITAKTAADGSVAIPLALEGACTLDDLYIAVDGIPRGYRMTSPNALPLNILDLQTGVTSFGFVLSTEALTPQPTWTPTVFPPPIEAGLVPTLDAGMVSSFYGGCPYVTQQEAESIFGPTIDPPTGVGVYLNDQDLDGALNCTFTDQGQSSWLTVWISHDQPTARLDFDAKRAIAGNEAIAVAGLGDQAYWWPLALRLDVVYLNTRLWVNFAAPSNASPDQAAAVAAAALQKIDPSLGAITLKPVTVPAGVPVPAPADIVNRDDLASGQPFESCRLLSESELESILGPLSSAPMETGGIGEMVGIVDGCLMDDVSYTIFFADSPAQALYSSPISANAALLKGTASRASWSVGDNQSLSLGAVRGNVQFGFTNYSGDTPANRAQLENLAKAIIKRIFEH